MKSKISLKGFSALFLLLCFVLSAFAQDAKPPAGVTKIASVEGITEYRLENGLKILLFPDPTKQTITVNVTYLVGSRHENYGETGMAHLLEHLMFKGSPRHPKQDAEANQHGARLNATTWFDRTIYEETFPANEKNLNWALDMEADRMLGANVTKKDLDSEFSVVRNEFEKGENEPWSVLYDKLFAAAFQWHNYGKTTIGARSDIENVPIERLQAFYKTYYQPDNAVLIISGNFNETRALELAHKWFSPLPKPARTLPKFYTDEPVQDGERQVTVRRVGDTQIVMAGYHLPPATHKDFAALDLLWMILGDAPSGRIHKALVETKKASSVSYYNYALKDSGYGTLAAELRKDMPLDAARDALLQAIENLEKNPPTEEELERARKALLNGIEMSFFDPEKMAAELAEWSGRGDWRMYFLHRDRIAEATLEDVLRAAKTYLKPANRTLAFFIPTEKPDRAEIPSMTDDDVLAMVKDYKGGEPVAPGEAFDPTPENIEARTRRATIGGLKIAFLPKKNRGESVYARLSLRFGDEKSLFNRSTAGLFAASMLDRGTKTKTRLEIQDAFDDLESAVEFGGDADGANVAIDSRRENLPAVLRLVAEVLKDAAFPENEFEQMKQEYLAFLESQKGDPQYISQRMLERRFSKYPKGDPRYVPTFDEEIAEVEKLTLDDVKKFYKDFYGASNGELAVVGDFDEKEIADLTKELFAGWKSPQNFRRVGNVYNEIPAEREKIETPDKESVYLEARLDLKMNDNHPDYPAVAVGSFIFGSGYTSRLIIRIREKEGLSYDLGTWWRADPLDEIAGIGVYATYAPQNDARFDAAFNEELARFLKDGITAEELADAKAGLLERYKVTRSQDAQLAGTLGSYLFLGRDFRWNAEFESKIAALTIEQVNAAMRKHFAPDKLTVVKAGDFAKAKK